MEVGFDIETSGLDPLAKIASVQFYFPETDTVEFLPINMLDLTEEDKSRNIERIKEVLDLYSVIGHNLGFDLYFIYRDFGIYPEVAGDSYIYSLMTQQQKNGLKDLVVSYGIAKQEDVVKYADLVPSKDFTRVSCKNEDAINYASKDPKYAYLLERAFRKRYPQYLVTYLTEVSYIEMFTLMKLKGLNVDYQSLVDFRSTYNEKVDEYKKGLNKLSDPTSDFPLDFRVRSAKELSDIFKRLNIPEPELRTKTGATSYSIESLEYLSGIPFIDGLLEYSSMFSVKNTLAGLEEKFLTFYPNGEAKIHATYKHVGYDATSRVYCEPSITSLPKEFRKHVKASPGKKFIYLDWSSAELIVAASIAKEEWILEAYRDGKDLHKEMASRLLNIPIDKVTPEDRATSKVIVFAINYGSEGAAVARKLKIPYEQATALVEKFWEACPNILTYKTNLQNNAFKYGGVYTITGRFRRLVSLFSKDRATIQKGLRQVYNTAIQSSTADLQKMFLYKIHEKVKNSKNARIVTTVFDSFLLEVSENQPMDQLENWLKSLSTFTINNITIDLKFEIKSGLTYYEASL